MTTIEQYKLAFEQDVIELLKKHKYLRDDIENFVTDAEITIVVTVSGEHERIITFNGSKQPLVKMTLSTPEDQEKEIEVK